MLSAEFPERLLENCWSMTSARRRRVLFRGGRGPAMKRMQPASRSSTCTLAPQAH